MRDSVNPFNTFAARPALDRTSAWCEDRRDWLLREAEPMLAQLLTAGEHVPGWWRVRSFLLPRVAALHRKRLEKVTFVAITGSAGKTTAQMLASAVLATAGRVQIHGAANRYSQIMSNIVATRSSDDFCVLELSAEGPGFLDLPLATVRPRIGVVTSIGSDHLKAFHSIEAIAEEKAKVIACLPEDGIAVLNADDARVLAMAQRCSGAVITFGRGENAALRAENLRAAWPQRLSFTARYQGSSVEIETRLCGTHWTPAVLAALGVGLAAGVPLQQAAKAVAAVEPRPSRMYPMTGDGGVTFILDDWKSSLWTMGSAFDFLRTAEADRKIIAIGTLSDYGGSTATVYSRVARAALEVADHVLFVGPMATHALRAKRPETAGRLHAFTSVRDAAEFLGSLLRRGDLVLVKGTMNADHLGRLAHHWLDPISCWRMDCRKNTRCAVCSELRAGVTKAVGQAGAPARTAAAPAGLPQCGAPMEVLVGIGNPGARYRNTPHNIGFDVLDALAARLGLSWLVHDDVALAHTSLNAKTLLLVKPQGYVNNTGKCLKELSEALGFRAEDCILIQDDIHLPLGKLRSRSRGSDGGHKGVRSVLVTFQTDNVRRLKIGMAPAEPPRSAADYLVSPLPPQALAALEPAVEAAVERLLLSAGGAGDPISGESPGAGDRAPGPPPSQPAAP